MTDRPIIFSGPMVRALLDGRKTQTRRLASSPLRRCEVGDRLYVRESWCQADTPTGFAYMADHSGNPRGMGWRPSIHMPRSASRLTLIVEDVRFQPLQEISEADAIAEGIELISCRCSDGVTRDLWHGLAYAGNETPIPAYADLWDSLHNPNGYCAVDEPTGWAANPEIVALTFRVVRANIDALDKEPRP